MITEKFGQRIKSLRNELGISQEKIYPGIPPSPQ